MGHLYYFHRATESVSGNKSLDLWGKEGGKTMARQRLVLCDWQQLCGSIRTEHIWLNVLQLLKASRILFYQINMQIPSINTIGSFTSRDCL